MTEKDNSDSREKSKSKSRTTKSGTRKTAAAKETTRAKTTASRKKPAASSAAAKKKETKTPRPRTRRTKGKETPEVSAVESVGSSELLQDVSPQLAAPEPANDEGALALAEWGTETGDTAGRGRLGGRGHVKPGTAAKAQPRPTLPARKDSDLLDIPGWPDLLDEPVTAKAPAQPARPAAIPAPAKPAPPPPPKPAPTPARAEQYEPAEEIEDEDFGPAPELDYETEAVEDEIEGVEAEVADEYVPETEVEPAGPEEGETRPESEGEEQPRRGRRRRRRRRGRNRNQNEQDQNGSAEQLEPGEAQRQQQPSSGQPARPPRPDREPRRDRESGAGRDFRREREAGPDRGWPAERPARSDERPRLAPPDEEDEPLAEPMGDLWTEEVFDEEEIEAVAPPDEKNGRLMLINVAEGEECRIAILHQNRLEELFIERASAESHVGNIYKGRVTNVEPSIQAAFVDFGLPKNGFLHISDLQPQYFPGGLKTVEDVGRKTPRRDRPPIQKCLRRGQEIIVQIIKEGIGTKGPTLTTYVSIPGRYLVMMPGMNRLGVSRRIEDDDARRKMRTILDELNLPKDMGFILRTAGLDRNKKELQQDLLYLQRLWKVVARRIKNDRAPCELYRESDLVIRTIRDVFSSDFSRIIVDDPRTTEKVRDFLAIAMPRSSAPVEQYTGQRPLFHEYKLEQEIERINSRYVPLPSGGSLVIESTEALVAIDVNSGKYREHDDAEETAFRINIEAAQEIARQLRLRDLGGLILCDFIDMRAEKHRRGVERALRDALKKHKERAKCLRMSQFGIIEMTRQRMRPSIKRSIYQDCQHCRGTGLIKNTESMTLDIMRMLRLATHHDQVETVEVRVSTEVAFQLQNRKRAAIHSMEQESGRQIIIRSDDNLGPDQYAFECLDRRGGAIRTDDLPETSRGMPEPRSKRRSGGPEAKPGYSRETLEDVFD